ncbi:MAG: 4Fe-4S binding protein, partial [Candidatus Bathyarchaeia archaeon]
MEGSKKVKGVIFNLVTGSFVDGYGIRTTVFLKGCPLRCIWCCDPEAHNLFPELKVDPSKCNACGRCVFICPMGAIQIDFQNKKLYVNRKICTNCGKCVSVCFTGALGMFGKYTTVEELFNFIKKGEEFFRASGGGVTIGGGEPTFQDI